MGAIDQRRLPGFQRLGRRDIGEDHEFFDQPMRVEPLGPAHALQSPLLVENQLALGQIEIERIALAALALQRLVGRPERLQDGLEQRLGRLVGMAVDRALRLLVGELGGRAHQDAVEAVALLAPVGADDHAHRERGAVLARAQRAQVVGDALGQHRHDAVGEIDRIAALQRFLVERGAGPDVPGDVGDRDGQHEAAGIGGVLVGRGVHRVVVVLGVGGIDGDERQRAPVLAMGERRGLGGVGLG